ncbi:unnamed protein product, partial [Phaeothamnion confervicola]
EADNDAEAETEYEVEYEDDQLRWERERDDVTLLQVQGALYGAMSESALEREAFRQGVAAARTVPAMAAAVFAFSSRVTAVLPLLLDQENEEKAVLYGPPGDVGNASNQAFFLKVTPTGEVVWARLQGFPWWPALVVRPDSFRLAAVLAWTGDRMVTFMGESDQYRV